jgi:signal transduction histidine kinase
MIISRIKYILSLLILCSMAAIASAQNNALKINDRMFEYYNKCQRVSKQPIALKMADTLFNEAGKIHDTKAQCLSFFIKGSYYFNSKDIDDLRDLLGATIKFVKKTEYPQYIFSVWNQVINHYANEGNYTEALKQIDGYQKMANELNSVYGIGNAYSKYGDIYNLMGNDQASIQEYLKAVNYYKSVNHLQDISGIYTRLSSRYYSTYDYDSAEKYGLEGLKLTLLEEAKATSYLCLIKIYIAKKQVDKVNYYFRELENWEKKYQLSYTQMREKKFLLVEYACMQDKYDEAFAIIDSSHFIKELEADYKYLIYKERGDYENAYKQYLINTEEVSKRFSKLQGDQLADNSAALENNRLKIESNALSLKNAEISINKLQAQHKLLEMEKEQDNLLLQNTQLELNNKNLEIASQDELAARQQLEVKRQQEKAALLAEKVNNRKNLETFIISLLSIILVISIIHAILKEIATYKIKDEMAKEAVARKEAQIARLEAEEADKNKVIFLQNVSHEIRTPLNSIVGFTEVLSDPTNDISSEDQAKYLDLIHSNSDSLTTLINDILDISKLESGTYNCRFELVDLKTMCNELLGSMMAYKSEGVELKLETSSDSLKLNTDRQRLSQLLTNLLTNACKHTSHGSITLSYMNVDNQVIFSVADTGSGIDPSESEKIFNPFEKLDTFKQGVGLGLTLCRQIAILLHGEIHLDISYSPGAKFIFSHPINPEA